MSRLNYSINLQAKPLDLMDLMSNFESYQVFLPQQLRDINIIEKNPEHTIIELTLMFSTILKKEIKIKVLHKILSENQVKLEIISGTGKGSMADIKFEEVESVTNVIVDLNLELGLKMKIFLPIIKKTYKQVLMSIFYKMNTIILDSPK